MDHVRRWLLLLGSNLPEDACLRAALGGLSRFGVVTLLTPVQRFSSYSDDAEYYNALVQLDADIERAVLHNGLRELEAELGRRRDSREVAVDIDILAVSEETRWRADRHALAKGEFGRAAVEALLRQASIAGIDMG